MDLQRVMRELELHGSGYEAFAGFEIVCRIMARRREEFIAQLDDVGINMGGAFVHQISPTYFSSASIRTSSTVNFRFAQ